MLFRVHYPRAIRGGAPEALAAAGSSLTSCCMPLFSFPFLEILPVQAPLVQTSTWLLTAQPGSLPRILQQTLCLGRGFSCPGPHAGPRDLIVLKHSSYRLSFQCPLSLVSYFHICWNTIGCSLCSSDHLGVSLVLRGSGLRSYLPRHHLPKEPSMVFFNIFY